MIMRSSFRGENKRSGGSRLTVRDVRENKQAPSRICGCSLTNPTARATRSVMAANKLRANGVGAEQAFSHSHERAEDGQTDLPFPIRLVKF